MSSSTETTPSKAKFFGFDHVHFWVGNALQAAAFYSARFGFQKIAYRGLETGSRDVVTHVIKQGKIVLAFSSPLRPGNKEMGDHMMQHGDGVKDIAMTVSDARAIWQKATAAGAVSVQEPTEMSDEHGKVVLSSVKTYGDTIHTFVERHSYTGPFLPGFVAFTGAQDPLCSITEDLGLKYIDHIVGNQGWDEMLNIEKWYHEKLGFHRLWSVDDKQIHTEYSALRSVVVTDDDKTIIMPINEPAEGKKKSQIEEYVEYYGGAGAQHIALLTDDILKTVNLLKARGLQFLNTPKSYYTDLRKRLAAQTDVQVAEDLDKIEELSILVDFDERGYLLQIFTKCIEDRPTLFIEIIQRRNNDGFGAGNFKALFESIERDQAARGNL